MQQFRLTFYASKQGEYSGRKFNFNCESFAWAENQVFRFLKNGNDVHDMYIVDRQTNKGIKWDIQELKRAVRTGARSLTEYRNFLNR